MTPDRPPGKIITFYSYKGGTGRSMALANVAWILAHNGYRVLTMDWDLEAPGLHRYFAPFLADKDLANSDGVIDIVLRYCAEAMTPATEGDVVAKDWYLPHANVLRYAASLDWDFPGQGLLDFVPAGRQGASYSARVNSFDWVNFYERLGGKEFFSALQESMRKEYDYILIDSRTGVSDTAGICTVSFPDILVVCFTLNNQSIQGAAAVARSIVEQRANSVAVFPVPMRLDFSEKDKLEARRTYAEQEFNQPPDFRFPNIMSQADRRQYWKNMNVQYVPYYSYEETLAIFGDEVDKPTPLLLAMEQLTRYLVPGEIRSFEVADTERRAVLARYAGEPERTLSTRSEQVPEQTSSTGSKQVDTLGPRPTRVFISYTHDSPEHDGRVLALADKLRYDGLDVVIDQYTPNPPQGWPQWMQTEMDAADFVLLVCTPDYYQRVTRQEAAGVGRGVQWEGSLIYNRIYANLPSSSHFIPLLFGDVDAVSIPGPMLGYTYYRLQQFDLSDPSYEALYRHLSSQPAIPKPALGDVQTLPPQPRSLAAETFQPWNVPYPRNPFFTGREDVLTQLRQALAAGRSAALNQPQAISGLGGIGKTQTAVEYAYRYGGEYKAVLWTGSEDKTALEAGFVDIARTLGLPAANLAEQSLAVTAAKRWLEDNNDWLLIFDNANTPELIKPFRPQGAKGHILLTSRATVFDQLGIPKPIRLAEMSPQEALEFLLQRTGRDDKNHTETEAARGLAKELGFLPSALEQAVAYILALSVSFQNYLDAYQKQRLKLLEKQRPVAGEYPETVATTWSLNFQEVEAVSEAATDLLRASAFLSPDDIPFELITLGAADLGDALSAALAGADASPLALPEVLQPLRRYSLITGEGDAYSVHRLVQAVIQDGMEADEKLTWQGRVIAAVNRALPEPEFSNWPLYDRLLPHALACATVLGNHLQAGSLETPEAGSLLNHTGWYLADRARYSEALALFERALAIREKSLGPEHTDTARSLNNLASLYYRQGRYEEALPLYQRALLIWEKVLGPEHPDTAMSLNNLAGLYESQGRYEDALPLFQRALLIREKVLGLAHPDTAQSLNDLAGFYQSQGRYEEASPLYQRAVAIRGTVLGPEHPDTAMSLNNLAGLYESQGRYEDALPLFQRALLIREKVLGLAHPDTAQSLNDLAGLYASQGRYEDALPLYQQALAICEKGLGPEHPKTKTIRENYTLLVQKMNPP